MKSKIRTLEWHRDRVLPRHECWDNGWDNAVPGAFKLVNGALPGLSRLRVMWRLVPLRCHDLCQRTNDVALNVRSSGPGGC